MTIIVTGDDINLAVSLKKDSANFAIASDAVIQAAIVSQDRSTVLAGPVTCSNAATGANWPASVIIVDIPSAETALITDYSPALLEIEVNDGGKLTWFLPLNIYKGNI